MKIKHLVLITIWGFFVTSCYDLTLEPKGIMGENELFGSETGVKIYFTGLYNNLPIEDFNYSATRGFRFDNYWEAAKTSLGNMSGEFVNSLLQVNTNGFGYWPYGQIRLVNNFINNFPQHKDNFPESTYNNLLGEAYFLRAFFYSGLAKRYGGVPIITEVQNPAGDSLTLKVPRATEYDTWKFIHDDLEFAMNNMVEPKSSSDVTRANRYAAAALMSRTMLYAASVAKYTQYLGFDGEAAVQQGFAGIDPSKANEFFQYAYDAGKLIENSAKYQLYTKNYPDKMTNFVNVFLDATSSENIFIKCYDKTSPQDTYLRHSYDALMCPATDMAANPGAVSYPSMDLMLLYDFPDIVDAEGKPIRFEKRSDIKNGMEPRLRATMYFDGDELREQLYSIQRGIYLTFPGLATDAKNGDNDAPINATANRKLSSSRKQLYNGVQIAGNHGCDNAGSTGGGENNCLTGAFVRKYIDPSLPRNQAWHSNQDQHWVVFRLGEIYLNMAEVCYELDKKDEAFDYIEKIRERAGCKVTRPADDPTDLSQKYGYPIDGNLQFIRDERYRELAFENHRWWDLRRWRVADRVLDKWIPRCLFAYYLMDEGTYIYLNEHEKNNRTWTAGKNSYYEGIPQGEINKNNNLLPQNPLR